MSSENAANMKFFRMVPEAFPPMRADKAALGYMPISAYHYCESMRAASSHGWYVFPPADIDLRFNGADVFVLVNGKWEVLSFAYLPGYVELWNESCKPEFHGLVPPYLRALPARGAVQIWSGWLMSTKPGWSTLVRPIVNFTRTHLYHCYEGLVETDEFQPCPLFMNIQLLASDVTISFPKADPFFQIQPMPRVAYSDEAHKSETKEGFVSTGSDSVMMSTEEWDSFRKTFKTNLPDDTHRLGDYGATARKRAKSES